MATATLDILVQLKDDASAALKGVSSSLQDMQKNIQPAADASKAFAIGLAAIGAAAGVAGAYVIGQARDSMAAQKQLNAVLLSTKGAAGVTADAAKNLADHMQSLTNYDDDAVLSAENMLLTFTNIGKNVFPQATTTVLDMATAMGTDTKDAAIQLGKALNNPVDGISALTRVGVTFTDQQKNTIQSLVDTGQTAKAQQVILDELTKEFGGSAEAVADPIIQMKNALNDAAKTIGLAILPAVDGIARAVANFATNVLPIWIARAQEVISFLKQHPVVLYAVAGAITGALLPAIITMGITLLTVTIPAFVAAAIALAPWIIGGALIGGIVAGIVWVVEHWKEVSQTIRDVWSEIVAFVSEHWEMIVSILFPGIGSLVAFVVDNWGAIKSGVTTAIAAVHTAITTVLGTIDAAWKKTWGGIKDFFGDVWSGIVDTFKAAINTIISGINAFIGAFDAIHISVPSVHVPHVGDFGGFSISVPQIPKIPLLANGGIVNSPTLAMIGEAGPEAVVPLGRFAGAGMGGLTININGNVLSGREAAIDMANEIARVLGYNRRI